MALLTWMRTLIELVETYCNVDLNSATCID